jgi:hypothetical protein
MLEKIRERAFALAARELGVSLGDLCEDYVLTPAGWYHVAIVCDVYLVAKGFIFWRRPTEPRRLGDIVLEIFQHNAAHAA